MDSVAHVNVPLRGGKKMKKRKELDALVAHTINKRCIDMKRSSSVGGISSHDQLLTDSTDEQDYWTSSTGGKPLRCQRRRYSVQKRTCSALLRACSGILIFSCVVATTAVMWLFIDVRAQVTSLRTELNQGTPLRVIPVFAVARSAPVCRRFGASSTDRVCGLPSSENSSDLRCLGFQGWGRLIFPPSKWNCLFIVIWLTSSASPCRWMTFISRFLGPNRSKTWAGRCSPAIPLDILFISNGFYVSDFK